MITAVRRDMLQAHPRGRLEASLTGVFATRSPDRPNPVGLHKVSVLEPAGRRLRFAPMEANNATPVVDIKAANRCTRFTSISEKVAGKALSCTTCSRAGVGGVAI